MTDARPFLFDSHAHFDDPMWPPVALAGELLAMTGWPGAISAGYGPERFEASRTITAAVPKVRRALGLHPWWIAERSEAAREVGLASLLAELDRGDAVALGEIGLDKGRRDQLGAADQLRWLERLIAVARARALPVILHVVGWHGHALAALRAAGGPWQGVVHRFSGAPAVALQYVDLGLAISLSLEPRADLAKQAAVARAVPADRLLVETDWPFLDLTYPQAQDALGAFAAQVAEWRGDPADRIVASHHATCRRIFGVPA